MPLIDVKCANDHIRDVNRPLSMYPATPPCPAVLADGSVCGAPTEQIHLPRAVSWSVDPVVVYRAADGSFRFPGDVNGPGDAKYARQGYERIELRSAADVRRFESVMNKREYARASRRVEALQAQRVARERETRSELARLMSSMTPMGRALARAAIERNNGKPLERAGDAGFHLDVYANDRGNRDESRDAQGRRRRD
jgi:hypothetical protein